MGSSNTHQSFQQPCSPLLRFRSAPSSLLSDFAQGIDSNTKRSNVFEGSDESERLVSRFGNRGGGGGNSNDLESQAPGNYSSSLPPHYPRLSSAVSSSCSSCSSSSTISSSLGLLGSNLARQSSSPAGIFSHQLNQNGINFPLCLCFLLFSSLLLRNLKLHSWHKSISPANFHPISCLISWIN